MIYYNQQNKILPDSCVSVYGQNVHCIFLQNIMLLLECFAKLVQCPVSGASMVFFFFFFFFFIEPGCNYHSPSLIFKLITVLLMKTHFYYSFHCYVFFFLVQHIQCVTHAFHGLQDCTHNNYSFYCNTVRVSKIHGAPNDYSSHL